VSRAVSAPEAAEGPSLPDGIPAALKISHFAAALNMTERTVRGWVDRGKVEALPTPMHCTRYISTQELVRLEALGWPVDWERIIELGSM
jgi:hypothetical protein